MTEIYKDEQKTKTEKYKKEAVSDSFKLDPQDVPTAPVYYIKQRKNIMCQSFKLFIRRLKRQFYCQSEQGKKVSFLAVLTVREKYPPIKLSSVC